MVSAIGSFGSFGVSLARAGGHGTPHPKKPVDPNEPSDPNKPVRGHDPTDVPSDSGDGSRAASEQEAFELALRAVALTIMNDVMADAEEAMAETEEDT